MLALFLSSTLILVGSSSGLVAWALCRSAAAGDRAAQPRAPQATPASPQRRSA
jgi:hypothetical protein